ncbi:D-aminoacylase [Fodinisporobacter ferrooxydans]|uniref:D-aminoacylase n=1 Tax=Fodinisporobacter ferrooxydans TaxID=2901836 RepID=A0ABY4CNA0_9BACL|nr:D-aminoacylase [Alicyclobacillaceae bacterium MYW30-H2]
MIDLVIRNGLIVDGMGNPAFVGDISIHNGHIVNIGVADEQGECELNSEGMVVFPGFIDAHTHSDIALLEEPGAVAKISQGVTTEILGNCGFSVAPIIKSDTIKSFRQYCKPVLGFPERLWTWSSYSEYIDMLKEAHPAVNYASLVGHSTLRCAVMGFENRSPTVSELSQMKALLEEALQQGAFGISTGLAYTPGAYAGTEELIELSRVVAKYGGIYTTHLRNQGDMLVGSVKEAIEIGVQSGVAIHISHHKVAGEKNAGLVNRTLSLLDETFRQGIKSSSDMYPYLAGSTTLASLLPPWLLEGGVENMLSRLRNTETRKIVTANFENGVSGWENRINAIGYQNVVICSLESLENRKLQGMGLVEIAKLRHESELECMFNLLLEENGDVGVILKNSTEVDLQTVLKHSRTVVGSDGLYSGDHPHPRLFGTFPRMIRRYVNERPILSLTEAIRKMTGLTAELFNLSKVGKLQKGFRADIVVFDPKKIKDNATFDYPCLMADGIHHVLVGGCFALKDGQVTGLRNGNFLAHSVLGSKAANSKD